MWCKCLIILLFNIKFNCAIQEIDVSVLLENLLSSIQVDPFLNVKDLNDVTKSYIDGKVESYIDLMNDKYGKEKKVSKRSAPTNAIKEHYTFQKFLSCDLSGNESYRDFTIFQYGDDLLAAALANTRTRRSKLELYKLSNNESCFDLIYETDGKFADKLYAISAKSGAFVVSSYERKVFIYRILGNRMNGVQTLNVTHASDINLWENDLGLFMGIARNHTDRKRKTKSLIYKWIGEHFDEGEELTTNGASAVSGFSVGSAHYVAITNSINEDGLTDIFSSIFKYNLDVDEYTSNQKIPTNRAVDVAYAECYKDNRKEFFLIVINSEAMRDNNNLSISIVYKIVDGYFMPFQTLSLNEPKEIITITTPNQNLLLMISTKTDGLKLFLYDGWIFKQVQMIYDDKTFEMEINSLKTVKFKNKQLILLRSKGMIRVYELKFEEPKLSYEEEMMEWCQQSIKNELNWNTTNYVTDKKVQVVKYGGFEIVSSPAQIKDVGYDKSDNDCDNLAEELNNITNTLKRVNDDVDKLWNQRVFDGDIEVDELVVNDVANLSILHSNTINGFNINNILNKKIDVGDDNNLSSMKFSSIEIKNEFLDEEELRKLLEGNKLEKLVIDGNVTAKDLKIDGFINNVKINKTNILLRNGSQTFDGEFIVNGLKSDKISINTTTSRKINDTNELRVKKLKIGGLLNGVNITEFDKNVTEANRVNNEFKQLKVDNVYVEGLVSNKSINKILLKTNKITFPDEIKIKNLVIKNNLNKIKVINGNLDLLKRNSSDIQAITGKKTFDNIHAEQIKLPGYVKSEMLRKSNPNVFIDEKLNLKGNYNITGAVTIERSLNTANIRPSNRSRCLNDIENSIKLTDNKINKTVAFKKINATDLGAENINDFKPGDLLIAGINKTQEFPGSIRVNADLFITGNAKIINLNGVSLAEFAEGILKINEEQNVTGIYYLEKLSAGNIKAKDVKVNNKTLREFIESRNNIHDKTIIFNDSVKIKELNVDNLVLNTYNGVNVSKVLNESVTTDDEYIGGVKVFKNLFVEDLFIKNGINMNETLALTRKLNGDITVEEEFFNLNKLKVNSLEPESINGVKSEDFRRNWLENADSYELDEEYRFNKMTIIGKSTVEDNRINDLDLNHLVENAVKTTDDFRFENAEFGDAIISSEGILLKGDLKGLDLSAAVTNGGEINGSKIFKENVKVHGNLTINGDVAGFNYTNLCEFASNVNDKRYDLVVDGSVVFTKGPAVESINRFTLSNASSEVWLNDREAVLDGLAFFGNATFKNDISVEGNISGINLNDLKENYFSLTRNQTVEGTLKFNEGVNFFKGVTSPVLDIEGKVSGVAIGDLTKTAILDGYDQIFDETIKVKNVEMDDIQGEYLVNQMNVHRDVMRYSVDNTVTGKKYIESLQVDILKMIEPVLIQNVDVLKWIERTVSKDRSNYIQGSCVFQNETTFTKNVGVAKKVNGAYFNNSTVLLTAEQQTFGNVTISGNGTRVDIIRMRGLLNGVEVETFLRDLAYNNTKMVKIRSPANIYGEIDADNVYFEKNFNGVNVTQLMRNFSTYKFEDYRDKFTGLLEIGYEVEKNLRSFANYLDRYEYVQSLHGVYFYHSIIAGGRNKLLVKMAKENACELIVYDWNKERKMFLNETVLAWSGRIVCDATSITEAINFKNESYVYYEDPEDSYVLNLTLDSETKLFIKQKLPKMNMIKLHSFTIEETQEDCFCVISPNKFYVYCKNGSPEFNLLQEKHVSLLDVDTVVMYDRTHLVLSTNYKKLIENNKVFILGYDRASRNFNLVQSVYVTSPSAISTIHYKRFYYLAIATRPLNENMIPGAMLVMRYKKRQRKFLSLQTLDVEAPGDVQLSILPSDELALYIRSSSPIESLLVYTLEGLFGFKKKITASVKSDEFAVFDERKNHLALLYKDGELKVLRAFFKSLYY